MGCGKSVSALFCARLRAQEHSCIYQGFMRHPPNLLKQESSSAATLVHVLLRIASDKRPEHAADREEASTRLTL